MNIKSAALARHANRRNIQNPLLLTLKHRHRLHHQSSVWSGPWLWLPGLEDFIEFICRESFKTCNGIITLTSPVISSNCVRYAWQNSSCYPRHKACGLPLLTFNELSSTSRFYDLRDRRNSHMGPSVCGSIWWAQLTGRESTHGTSFGV